ncbi:hypothetical protein HYW40_00505 [Candidatus Curtissbacteria bacterium]|nr:hypothetical protein [Candidatus Curtissbacteria bacterium]
MKHRDKLTHAVLLIGFTVGIGAFFRARDSQEQFLVVLALTLFYLVWGFTHHHLRGDITVRLLLEYLAIAAIASVVNVLIFGR